MRYLLLLLALVMAMPTAYSEGLGRPRPKIAAPEYPQHPAAKDWVEEQKARLNQMQGVLYGGVLAQYTWTDEETPWLGGAFAGAILKNNGFAFGIEGDALRRFENLPCHYEVCPDEVDNWLFTLRGIAGVYLNPSLLAYGTAGLAWEGDARNDFVWGGGLKLTTTEKTFVKAEALKIERDDEPLLFRVGLGFTF